MNKRTGWLFFILIFPIVLFAQEDAERQALFNQEEAQQEDLEIISQELIASYQEYQSLLATDKEAEPVSEPAELVKPQTMSQEFFYHINTGDVLEISVYGEKDLDSVVKVSEDGKINYSLLGEVEVAGLTVVEATEKLTELLEKDYLVNPKLRVFIKEYAKFNILGEVKKPGTYELKSIMTVIDAVALAGGFTDIASQNGVRVIRKEQGQEAVIKVPVASILKSGDKSKDVILKKGDTIVVPESFF